ncbi:MAG TPA: DUF697 domain-containing protein [bacterium]
MSPEHRFKSCDVRKEMMMCDQCRRSEKTIKHYSRLAGLVGMAPIPGADMPLLWGLQGKMIRDISRQFGHEMTPAESGTMVTSLGAGGFLARGLARQFIKLLPGLGWLISGAVAAAGTRVFGRVALNFIRDHYGEAEHVIPGPPPYRQIARG